MERLLFGIYKEELRVEHYREKKCNVLNNIKAGGPFFLNWKINTYTCICYLIYWCFSSFFPSVSCTFSSPLFLRVSAVGWGVDQGVGGFGDDPGIKAQILNLIRSVRTVMRGR